MTQAELLGGPISLLIEMIKATETTMPILIPRPKASTSGDAWKRLEPLRLSIVMALGATTRLVTRRISTPPARRRREATLLTIQRPTLDTKQGPAIPGALLSKIPFETIVPNAEFLPAHVLLVIKALCLRPLMTAASRTAPNTMAKTVAFLAAITASMAEVVRTPLVPTSSASIAARTLGASASDAPTVSVQTTIALLPHVRPRVVAI